jgi:hypothetical protein
MKIQKIILFLFTVTILLSCEKEDGENENKVSYSNSSQSHKNGQNCMNCHKSGGGGDGWFTVAGSVYNKVLTNPYLNGTVKLTTEPQNAGTSKLSIEIDKNGNFYTTEFISLTDGFYVSVTGTSGLTKYMSSKVTSGECNSCHGNTTGKIWAE